jgi:hypothetical protein
MRSLLVAIGLGEARRHELDKFRERVPAVEAEFRSMLSREKPSLACYSVRNGRIRPQPFRDWPFGGVTQDLLKRDELHARLIIGARVRRGAT